MLSEEQKQQKLCPLSSSKTSLLRTSTYIFEKIIDWHQTMMFKQIEKDVEWRAKTAKTVPTVFEQKFAFETFWLHFWENGWLISNNYDEFDWKRCWVNNKTSKYIWNAAAAIQNSLDTSSPWREGKMRGSQKVERQKVAGGNVNP